ncbi:ABC transporter substrate-binding protein [Massilia sp. CF038]|uniref:ABC transporter substrate-binding protein n=1 Tax=Massilia sp. CF038 TaxID=1881045 RepID=UPI0009138B8F|nr:ABC transporter substrate-binding protein [Massilia sp. CF038]SHG65984.1 amino acid/amide ABC transporter substrate-binding protein, HAAT family [Massilia sp. CF038]
MSVRSLCARLLLGGSLMLAAQAGAAESVITVGQAIDLSGPNGSIGRDYVAGITTYFDSINAKGGVNGKKIRYIVRDDRGIAAESAKLVDGLITQDQADYLLGAIGAEATKAQLAAPAFRQSKHALFAPLADSFTVPNGRAVFWRPSADREFQFILAYFKNLGVTRVGVALQRNAQNDRSYQVVVDELQKRGMTLAAMVDIGATAAATDAGARRLNDNGAKMVITIADTVASAQFLKAFRKQNPSTFVAGTSLINLEMLSQIAGSKATEFTVFSQVVPNPGSTASVLQSEHINMMKKFRDEPASALTLEGFAVAKTLVRTMQPGSAGKAPIDLGGMTIVQGDRDNNLSQYVDIALFKRGGGLMY